MNKISAFIPLIVLVLLMSGCTQTGNIVQRPADFDEYFENTTANVSKVIDGDTIELETGEKLRLLGINTQERGQKCYTKAKEFLKDLVEGKEVILQADLEDEDKYGRLLRYIFVDDVFVNLELVKQGLANKYMVNENSTYIKEIEDTENLAKNGGGCIWEKSKESCAGCIGVNYFHWNAKGDDCENPNDEYIVFKNGCSQSCELTGWTVEDEGRNKYEFQKFILNGQATVAIYSGSGTDTETELYWNNKGTCKSLWNNEGDTVYLYDRDEKLVLSEGYKSDEYTEEMKQDLCEGIVCSGSTAVCGDGYQASCSNSCTGGVCSSCIPDCTGHESEEDLEEPETCTENWSCSAWSDCSNSQQTRTCTDSNNCGTEENKPAETQSCTMPESPEEPEQADGLNPIINEIMYNPTQDENYNEWIEIYNPSNQDFDLTDWTFCGKALIAGYIDRVDATTKSENGLILQSHGFAVITDGDSGTDVYTNFNVADSLALHVDAGSICSRLSNSGKTITLEDSAETVVDSATYTNEFANGNEKTLEKSGSSWLESLQDGGTPGGENSI